MPSNEMPAGLPTPPPLGAAALPAGTYDGSVVLVTGGGTGLGAAIATEFARLGADLVVASRNPDHLAAWFLLGNACWRADEGESALAAFEQALARWDAAEPDGRGREADRESARRQPDQYAGAAGRAREALW